MSVRTASRQVRRPLTRGIVAGSAYGLVTGGLAGTPAFPIVGTFFGAVAGAGIGALLGAFTALALQPLTLVSTTRWAMRLAGGLIAGTLSAVVVSVLGRADTLLGPPAVLVVLATFLGACLAPWIAGHDGELPARSTVETGQKLLLAGTSGGAGLGAVVGLGIGLATYLPTSPVAMIEGSILGAMTGLLLTTMVLLAMLALKPSRR
jgi:hypothetical protein